MLRWAPLKVIVSLIGCAFWVLQIVDLLEATKPRHLAAGLAIWVLLTVVSAWTLFRESRRLILARRQCPDSN
jgi:hypothetical protein